MGREKWRFVRPEVAQALARSVARGGQLPFLVVYPTERAAEEWARDSLEPLYRPWKDEEQDGEAG